MTEMDRFLNKDWRLALLLLGYSALVLTMMSPDSPLHGDWNHWDSGCFFMSGKAVMNGLQPYVDFADSKGPLLWLWWGIGYLISPRSYTGMWLLGIICYTIILFYHYHTARVLLKDNMRSLLVTLLMVFPYFFYWFHYEVRAEDFCTIFVSVSIYYMFHLLYGEETEHYTVRRYGLVFGGCFMALILIKYNIAAMQGTMILAALWYFYREQGKFREPVVWMLAGAVVVAFPFIIWLVAVGSLGACIQEYFINTFETLKYTNVPTPYWKELLLVFEYPERLSLLLFIIFGGWLLSKQLSHNRYVPLFVGVFFFCMSTKHYLDHYYCACSVVVFFLILASVNHAVRKISKWHLTVTLTVIVGWLIMENTRENAFLHQDVLSSTDIKRTVFEDVSNVLSETPKPRIMYLYAGEWGYGIRAEALPAGKYWLYQYGSTPKMEQEHIELLKSGRADYVIVIYEDRCLEKGLTPEVIKSYGYETCYTRKHLEGIDHPTTTIYKRR